MPHRKSRALASLALATALATALPVHAAPLHAGNFFARFASLVERAWGRVVPAMPEPPATAWEKEGPSADPDGQPRPGVVVPPEPEDG